MADLYVFTCGTLHYTSRHVHTYLQYGAWVTSKKPPCLYKAYTPHPVPILYTGLIMSCEQKHFGYHSDMCHVARAAIAGATNELYDDADHELSSRGSDRIRWSRRENGLTFYRPEMLPSVVLALGSSPCRCHPSTLRQWLAAHWEHCLN